MDAYLRYLGLRIRALLSQQSPVCKHEHVAQLVNCTGDMFSIPMFVPISQVPRDTVFPRRVRGMDTMPSTDTGVPFMAPTM